MSAYGERLNAFNDAVDRTKEMAESAAEYVRGMKDRINDPSQDLFTKINDGVNTTAGMVNQGAQLYGTYKNAQVQSWNLKKDILDVKQDQLKQVLAKKAGSMSPANPGTPQQTPEISDDAFSSQASRVKNLPNASDIKSQIAQDPVAGKNPLAGDLSNEDKQAIFDARDNIVNKSISGAKAPATQSPPTQSQAPPQAQNVASSADQNANSVSSSIGSSTDPVAQSSALTNDVDDAASVLSKAPSAVSGMVSQAGNNLPQGVSQVTGALKDFSSDAGDAASQLVNNTLGQAQQLAGGVNNAVQDAGSAAQGLAQGAEDLGSNLAKAGSSLGESLGTGALDGVADGLLASAPELGPAGVITGAVGGLIQLGTTIAGWFHHSKPTPPPAPTPVIPVQASIGANLSTIQK